MQKFVCVHGHFYQPPRENPWLESVELQDSAAPYHDWNERIAAECYAPNATARILDGEGKDANAPYIEGPKGKLYPGLRSDIPKLKEKLAEFCQRNHILRLALFGSAIRGGFGPKSDLDVLVEFEPGRTPGFGA